MNKKDNNKIKELNKFIKETEQDYDKQKQGKNLREQHDIDGRCYAEISQYIQEINDIETQDLIKQAYKYCILVPDRDNEDLWYENDYREKVLTNKGKTTLKISIRNEKRENLRINILYFSTISSLIIGLMGTAIGLFSMINK